MPPPYVHDPSIEDRDDLWRRIPPWHFVPDENLGRIRPSSAAFEDDEDGEPMSVFVARVVAEHHLSERDVLSGLDGFGLVAITAGLARQNKQTVCFEEAEIIGHAVVVGKKSNAVKKCFYKNCVWVVPPRHTPTSTV